MLSRLLEVGSVTLPFPQVIQVHPGGEEGILLPKPWAGKTLFKFEKK